MHMLPSNRAVVELDRTMGALWSFFIVLGSDAGISFKDSDIKCTRLGGCEHLYTKHNVDRKPL
jgi:hypothetical protein